MKLKPCPFCGGGAEFRRSGRQGHYIACKGCDSSSTMFTALKGDVRDLLIQTWNSRYIPNSSPLSSQVHDVAAIRAKAVEDVLSALTAHELYQYRPNAFKSFIDYARSEILLK